MNEILTNVCKAFDVTSHELKSKSKIKEIYMPRNAFMYIAYRVGYFQKDIGEFLNKSTAGVCNQIKSAKNDYDNNAIYREKIDRIFYEQMKKSPVIEVSIKPEIARWISQNIEADTIGEGVDKIFRSWESMMFGENRVKEKNYETLQSLQQG